MPRYQVTNSPKVRNVQIAKMNTVHCPPRRDAVVKLGFVLAKKKVRRQLAQSIVYPVN